MSEDFLLRWSRRKRDAARAAPAPVEPPPAEPVEVASHPDRPAAAQVAGASAPAAGPDPLPAEAAAPADAEGAFDLADLPNLEEISGDTPIGAFLRRGVPDQLRREALRRAWTSDPVISTFIEMADYDWDFNAPGGNQVYGPLPAGLDIARMAEEIFSGSPRREPPAPTEPEAVEGAGEGDAPEDDSRIAAPAATDTVPEAPATARCCDATSPDTEHLDPDTAVRLARVAELHEAAPEPAAIDGEEPPARPRRHGSALPQWK